MARTSLPKELDDRLRGVWQELGCAIDWCDSDAAWTTLFCSEARPYRETFYWESVARMVARYRLDHSAQALEEALTDCLVATQCPPSSGEREALTEFRGMWEEILRCSQEQIDQCMRSDLELAQREGAHKVVAALYAADRQKWGRE